MFAKWPCPLLQIDSNCPWLSSCNLVSHWRSPGSVDQKAEGRAGQWWFETGWLTTKLGAHGHCSTAQQGFHQIRSDNKCGRLARQVWGAWRFSGWIARQQLCGRVWEMSPALQAKLCNTNCHWTLWASYWSASELELKRFFGFGSPQIKPLVIVFPYKTFPSFWYTMVYIPQFWTNPEMVSSFPSKVLPVWRTLARYYRQFWEHLWARPIYGRSAWCRLGSLFDSRPKKKHDAPKAFRFERYPQAQVGDTAICAFAHPYALWFHKSCSRTTNLAESCRTKYAMSHPK